MHDSRRGNASRTSDSLLWFFEDEAGQAVTVNGNQYHAIRDFLWPRFNGMDIQEL